MSGNNTEQPPPRGRDETRAALLSAAAQCFAVRGIRNTSVREIAQKARVNHGLVHRHFGSKERLLKTLLSELSNRVDSHLDSLYDQDSPPPPEQLLPLIFSGTSEVGLHWRVVLRALLEGIPPEELQSQFPVFKRLVSSYRVHGYDETKALAEAVLTFSTGLGFLTFQEYLAAAVEDSGGEWTSLKPRLMGRFLTRST